MMRSRAAALLLAALGSAALFVVLQRRWRSPKHHTAISNMYVFFLDVLARCTGTLRHPQSQTRPKTKSGPPFEPMQIVLYTYLTLETAHTSVLYFIHKDRFFSRGLLFLTRAAAAGVGVAQGSGCTRSSAIGFFAKYVRPPPLARGRSAGRRIA